MIVVFWVGEMGIVVLIKLADLFNGLVLCVIWFSVNELIELYH